MKQKRSDILFLMTVLFILSISIGVLHGGKSSQTKPMPFVLPDSMQDLSVKEVRRLIDPLLFSHSVYSAAQALAPVSAVTVQELLHELFIKPNPLTRDEKFLLLILVAQSQKTRKDRYALYDMLTSYDELQKGAPVLAIAARIEDPRVLGSLLNWMAYRKRRNDYEQLKNWVKLALQYTIQDNDFPAFKRLFDQRIRVSSQFASLLLVRAIQENKDIRFASFLISKGVKPNFVGPNKRTFLMEAVLQKNEKMVQELLNLGADPNFLADPEVGSAIQLAYERGYKDIELLMRRHVEKSSFR
jgi:hypothetical protein